MLDNTDGFKNSDSADVRLYGCYNEKVEEILLLRNY